MANKDFGVKKIDLIGSSGTPNLTSPGNLNLNAVTVAISTDLNIGGSISSPVRIGAGQSVSSSYFETTGLGITVFGSIHSNQLSVSGVVTATSFVGDGSGLTGIGGTTALDASNLTSGTIPDARFPATLPALSGANLTNLTSANLTGALPAIDGSALTNLPAAGISTSQSNVQVTYNITSNGTVGYRFNGPGQNGSTDNPDLYLVRGQRYRFINETTTSHPFAFKLSAGGVAYTEGITGSQTGTQEISVQEDAPSQFTYECTIHGGMNGNIYVVGGPQVIAGVVTATTFSGSGSGLTNLDASNLSSGTLPDARFPTTLPAVDGSALTNIVVNSINTSGVLTASQYVALDVTGDGSDRGFTTKYFITSNGAAAYRFAGPGQLNTEDNPTLYFHRGFTYILQNSTGSGHPFELRVSDGGAAYSPGGSFLTGSTTGTQVLTVPFDAPSSIVYQCTIHGGMVGTINFVS